MMEDLKKQNILYLLVGIFFVFLSGIIGSFFLPYFLKENGMTIFQIGFLLTIGLAIGSLVISIAFSRIQKRIKLRSGLISGATLVFFSSAILFALPNAIGTFFREIFYRVSVNVGRVSEDIAFQHNASKHNQRSINSLVLIFEGLAYLVGLFLAVVLIKLIDYRWSFLIFALFSIPAIIFYYKVKEETRFKSKKKSRDEKISTTLKWFLAADIIFNFALSSSFVLVMTFLVTDKYSGSIEWLAFLFGTLYLFMTLSTFTTKRFFDKKHLVLSTMLGMIIILASTFLIIFSTNLYVVLIAMVLEGIGAGIWVPSQYAYYWKLTKPSQRETVSGYFNGIKSFVKALGPLVGGGIAAMFGILGPFYLKIIFALIAIWIYVFVFIRVKHLK